MNGQEFDTMVWHVITIDVIRRSKKATIVSQIFLLHLCTVGGSGDVASFVILNKKSKEFLSVCPLHSSKIVCHTDLYRRNADDLGICMCAFGAVWEYEAFSIDNNVPISCRQLLPLPWLLCLSEQNPHLLAF